MMFVTAFRRAFVIVGLASVCVLALPYFVRVLHADSLPRVQLNADSIQPRKIEDLTGKNVARDYAIAWKDLSEALNNNRATALNGYFTGFAKDALNSRVAEQKRTGIHTRYVDHGHRASAVFYSADGGEMQLIDEANLEMQILEGDKILKGYKLVDFQDAWERYLQPVTHHPQPCRIGRFNAP